MLKAKAKSRGLFITLEGTEGSGKSTLLQGLEAALKSQGFQTLRTREPGGTALSEKIRELIIHEKMEPWNELFLYQASRAEHVAAVIRPALADGKIVLCDRFTASSLAYQAFARGLPWKEVKRLSETATQGLEPDLNFFLDLDPKIGLARAKDPNKFEKEGLAFHQKVRKGFLKVIQESPKKWVKIDVSDKNPEEVCSLALEKLQRYLSKCQKA